MSEIILHHYPESPYSEKVRLVLGLKGLEWRSVVIPNIMPKPDLTPLTGGYRRTPVMQIGAEIFCDSQVIVREGDLYLVSDLVNAPYRQRPLGASLGQAGPELVLVELFAASVLLDDHQRLGLHPLIRRVSEAAPKTFAPSPNPVLRVPGLDYLGGCVVAKWTVHNLRLK